MNLENPLNRKARRIMEKNCSALFWGAMAALALFTLLVRFAPPVS